MAEDPVTAAPTGIAERRFAGVARVYGEPALVQLHRAHVVVIGVGGVGSWAAEALARSGVGTLTLIDLDNVAESNINRQVHALESTLGAVKIEVMAQRIGQIAPACNVLLVEDFLTGENVARLVPSHASFVIDAIDQPSAKAALVATCVERGQRVVVSGAAGGRTDPLRLKRGDLAHTSGDALLASVRARLRRNHGFARDVKLEFGVPAIYSDEPLREGQACATDGPGTALSCSGYGSLVGVTASMGFATAQFAIDSIARTSAE